MSLPQWHVRQIRARHNPYDAERILRLDDLCSECGANHVFVGVDDLGEPLTPSWCDECCSRDEQRDRYCDGRLYYLEPGNGTRYLIACRRIKWPDAPSGEAWLLTFGPNRAPLVSWMFDVNGYVCYEYVKSKLMYTDSSYRILTPADLAVAVATFSAMTGRPISIPDWVQINKRAGEAVVERARRLDECLMEVK